MWKETLCSREKGHKGLCNKLKKADGFWENSAPKRRHMLSVLNTSVDSINEEISEAQSVQGGISDRKKELEEEINNMTLKKKQLRD